MWTKKWPEERGFYWFYGRPYNSNGISYSDKEELFVVEVVRIHKNFVICINLSDDTTEYGESLISEEKTQGMWQKIQPPKLPGDYYDTH